MPVKITDNRTAFLARFNEARKKGVVAAGDSLLRSLKKAFGSGYYTSGRYRQTLGVKQSLRRSGAEKGPEGYFIRVGSKFGELKKGKGGKSGKHQMVPLFWELGWTHAVSGRQYRKEIFRPTAINQAAAIRAEFAKTFKRYASRPLS